MVRTVSLRPNLPKDRFLPMLESCVEIFDAHTKWATENRTYSKQKAHEGLYRSIRESHPEIPSAILQTTRDCALEASKRDIQATFWSIDIGMVRRADEFTAR